MKALLVFCLLFAAPALADTVAENRALLAAQWHAAQEEISGIQVAVSCGIVTDKLLANMAVRKLQAVMDYQQIELGLVGDATMRADIYVNEAAQAARARVSSGFCAQVILHTSAAERAALRLEIERLARFGPS